MSERLTDDEVAYYAGIPRPPHADGRPRYYSPVQRIATELLAARRTIARMTEGRSVLNAQLRELLDRHVDIDGWELT
jgi:hypothetical protein